MIKAQIAQISGRMVYSGTSDIVIIIIMKKIARNDVFSQVPEIDFHYERKVIVDFKFNDLYRYVSIESLLKSGE